MLNMILIKQKSKKTNEKKRKQKGTKKPHEKATIEEKIKMNQ